MYTCPYIQDDAKQSYYRPLKHSAILEAPSEPPFQEPLLSESNRKEKITNKRNIFTVKLECTDSGSCSNSTASFSEIEHTTRVEISKLCQHVPSSR